MQILFTPQVPRYNLFFLIILALLVLAVLGVVLALRYWGYRQKPWTVLFAAYGLPLLAALIAFVWLWGQQSPLVSGRIGASVFRSIWQPLYQVWYTAFLLFSGWFLFPPVFHPNGFNLRGLIRGLLTGLGVGLCGAFFCSIFLNQFELKGISLFTPLPPEFLRWTVFALSLTVTPYAVQRFYRTILEPAWAGRFPFVPEGVLTAALFALTPLRPILLPVAFAASLGFRYLYQRSQLWTVVLAHAACNLVLMIIGWYLVI